MMSLTAGWGPLGEDRRGRFDFDPPEQATYVEDYPRRVRGSRGGETVIDSLRAKLLWQTGAQPQYCFPEEDAAGLGASAPGLRGWSLVPFDAVETWHEEDVQVFGHVRDPYHRIDVYPTARLVRISLNGELLAESRRAQALFETALPTRWYLPREDLRVELERSEKRTVCAYKGFATHWSVPGAADIAWSYENPLRDAELVRDFVSFYNERVDVELDGELQERPVTPFS